MTPETGILGALVTLLVGGFAFIIVKKYKKPRKEPPPVTYKPTPEEIAQMNERLGPR